jgi:hypothetical protein
MPAPGGQAPAEVWGKIKMANWNPTQQEIKCIGQELGRQLLHQGKYHQKKIRNIIA